MKLLKKPIFILLTALLIVSLLPISVSARGFIDLDKDVKLTVVMKDDDKPIEGVLFDVYRVAGLTETGTMVLTEEFDALKDTVTGLRTINDMTETS